MLTLSYFYFKIESSVTMLLWLNVSAPPEEKTQLNSKAFKALFLIETNFPVTPKYSAALASSTSFRKSSGAKC